MDTLVITGTTTQVIAALHHYAPHLLGYRRAPRGPHRFEPRHTRHGTPLPICAHCRRWRHDTLHATPRH